MELIPGDSMIEEMLYNKFLRLTELKQLDYLYTAFVENDMEKLANDYGPKSLSVSIGDDEIIILAPELKDARVIRDNMMLGGMILVDEKHRKTTTGCVVSYMFEGTVQPICLN